MSFYVRIRGRVHGPMDASKLQSLAAKGQLSRIHEISQDQQTWQPASTMPELFSSASSGNAAGEHTAGAASPQRPIQSTMVEPTGGNAAAPSGSITSTAIEQPGVSMQPSSMGDSGMVGGNFGAGGGNAFGAANHDQWYYAIDDNQAGPLSMATLLQLIQNGTVGGRDMVWKEGMGDWREVDSVAELAASLPASASNAGGLEIHAGQGSAEGHLIAAVPWIRLVMIGAFLTSILWGLCSIAMMVLSIMASQVVLLIAWLVNLVMAGLLLHFGIVMVGLLGQCRMLRQSPSASSLAITLSQSRQAWKSLAIFITVVLAVAFMVAGLIVLIVALGADIGGLAPVLPSGT